MEKDYLSFSEFKKRALKNRVLKREYDRLEPEFVIIQAMIEARLKLGLTQRALANKIGTKQAAISRLENGSVNPSIGFLKKLAKALHCKLEINFLPQS